MNAQHTEARSSVLPLDHRAKLSFQEQLNRYEDELELLRQAMDLDPKNKFSDIHHFYYHSKVDRQIRINDALDRIKQCEGESDFSITPLIRCLYVDHLFDNSSDSSTAVNHQSTMSDPSCYSPTEKLDMDSASLELHRVEHTSGVVVHSKEPAPKRRRLSPSTRSSEQQQEVDNLRNDILEALEHYPFWPSLTDKENNRKMEKMVFWSENHLFMTLGSAFLYHQYKCFLQPSVITTHDNDNDDVLANQHPNHQIRNTATINSSQSTPLVSFDVSSYHKFRSLLLAYLQIHIHMNGHFEVNSPVYLPYSIAGLLNLYDFSIDNEIRELAMIVVNRMISQVMLTTDPLTGIMNLSANARNYARFRQRNFNHTINHLIKVLNHGINIDRYEGINYLDGFLVTTTWKPTKEIFQALYGEGNVSEQQLFNVAVDDVYHLFVPSQHVVRSGSNGISAGASSGVVNSVDGFQLDWIPFLWSAGLVTHPQYIDKTSHFLATYGLSNNKHLWALTTLGQDRTGSLMNHFSHFSAGQVYLDIKLNVYKRPGLVLSSFELYNPHKCGFQQSPWMANIGGVPVWSRSGKGAESVAGFGIQNTHNPAVQQRGNVLLVSYATPNMLQGWVVNRIFSPRVYLMWPEKLFDEVSYSVLSCDHDESLRRIFDTCHRKASTSSMFSYFSCTSTSSSSSTTLTTAPSSHPQGIDSGNMTRNRNLDHNSRDSEDSEEIRHAHSNTDNLHCKNNGTILPSLSSVMTCGEHVWLIGRKGSAYIACFLTNTGHWKVNDTLDVKDIYFQCGKDNRSSKEPITRIYTDEKNVSMVLVVETTAAYPTMESFVNMCIRRIVVSTDGKTVRVDSTDRLALLPPNSGEKCESVKCSKQPFDGLSYTYPG